MNQIISLIFITYAIKFSNSRPRQSPTSNIDIPKVRYHNETVDRTLKAERRVKAKLKGRRWRKTRPDKEDDNEIDLNHADFEDSALVSDLNENVIFDKQKDMELIQGDIVIEKSSHHHRGERGAVRPRTKIWPEGKIYYQFMDNQNLGPLKVQLVRSAMQHIMDHTCVRFIERKNNETDYLNITSEKGCYSWVGKQERAQELSVGSGCVTMGIIAHELAHAMGFYHEQSRPDRDNYVELIPENVKPGQLDNFKKRAPDEVNSLEVPYDYGSIMHYGLNDFSANKQSTLRTLRPVPPDVELIGQRRALSKQDIEQANLLYSCPKNTDVSVIRSNRHSGSLNSDAMMIVGGTQDTTEPLCIDGMIYRGNQVLVTMCSLSKSSLKWSWTDSYQLQNDGNTLCLSVQENHMLGGTEDVPLKMVACDDQDEKQKWMCSGGFLKNLALNKCINAAWKPYNRNYMIAASTCDNTNINQVMSVYRSKKKYEPVCRRWRMGVQLECHQRFTTGSRRSYLGCQNRETMIGYEKVGKRNNLKAIKSIECCRMSNGTVDNYYRTSIRNINKVGYTECAEDYFIQGIRLDRTKDRSLRALTYVHCMKASDDISYDNCYWDELRSQHYNKGMNVCSRGGFYMTGIYKERCSRLSCISKIKCCSVQINHNYT